MRNIKSSTNELFTKQKESKIEKMNLWLPGGNVREG